MKKLILGLIAAMALTFVACDDDDDPTVYTIGFEDVTLNSDGLFMNDSTSGSINSATANLSCTWDYTYGTGYCYGFVVSNQTDTTNAGYTNPYSCVAESGADGSNSYAVYYASYGDSIKFKTPIDLKSVELCNNAYAYDVIKNGNGYSRAFSSDSSDYFYVTLSLYDEMGVSLGSENFYLADFRNSASTIVSDWTELDLSSYTDVSYVKFSFTSTDTGAWGINTPTYFCLDNIKYYEE